MMKPSSHASRKSKQTSASAATPPACIMWLRQRGETEESVQLLHEQMKAQGLAVELTDASEVTTNQLASADLILLDSFEQIEGMAETMVTRIRMESRVPLVMLTKGYSIEQLITALTAGADAIWSLTTPVEVLMARCKALLRRWRPVTESDAIDQS